MKQKIGLVLGVTVSLILISATLVYSQEAVVSQNTTPATEPALETQPGPETQWLWGEVISVDAQKNELLVKYLDYEAEQEKQVTITVDDKTTYENVKALLETRPQDIVSIDYTLSPEGKNIAKNISVEKPPIEQASPEGGVPPAPPEVTPGGEGKPEPEVGEGQPAPTVEEEQPAPEVEEGQPAPAVEE